MQRLCSSLIQAPVAGLGRYQCGTVSLGRSPQPQFAAGGFKCCFAAAGLNI